MTAHAPALPIPKNTQPFQRVPVMARDGRQGLVRPPLPVVAPARHGHDVFDALVFAQQSRASDWALVVANAAERDAAAVELLAERLEALQRLALPAAIGQFLDAVVVLRLSRKRRL